MRKKALKEKEVPQNKMKIRKGNERKETKWKL